MTRSVCRPPAWGILSLVVSLFALNPMMVNEAAGVNMDVIPSVRLEEGWNSNVFNSSTNEVSSFGTRLTPGLGLRLTSPEDVSILLTGNYEILRYHDSDAEEADSDTWFFRLNSTGAWAFTPNLSMIPSVYYLNTNDSYRRTQLVPSGDPVLPPVTITNYGRTNTENFGGALDFSYRMTPSATIGVNGNYSEQRFTDSASDSGLTDSTTIGGNASVSYQFSPRTKLGILFAGNHQTYDNAPDSDTLSGGILFGYQFSPTFRVDGVFGMSYIRQNEAPGIPEERESAPSGLINFSYTSETFKANVYGSAVYSGGSGFGEASRQWTAGLLFSDQFARDWSWNLRGTYQVSQSVFVTDAVDTNTIYGTAGLSYKPWVWGTLDLTGNMDRQTSDGQFGDSLNNYSVILGFTVGRPFKIL